MFFSLGTGYLYYLEIIKWILGLLPWYQLGCWFTQGVGEQLEKREKKLVM
jgi:hypothetical protein